MKIELTATQRGFAIGSFKDRYGMECSIQKSALATEDCLWLGITEGTRMHLTRQMAGELAPLLGSFSITGELSAPPKPTTSTIIEAMRRGHNALTVAITDHIYDADNGEHPPAGCRFVVARDSLFLAMDSARKLGAFTHLQMEAALCAWEAMLESRLSDEAMLNPGDYPEWQVTISSMWSDHGSGCMRSCSIQAGEIAERVYAAMEAKGWEFHDPYDFEFVPTVLALLDWQALMRHNQYGGTAYEPDIEVLLTAMVAKRPDSFDLDPKKSSWLASCRYQAQKQWAYPELLTDHEDQFDQAFEAGEDAAAFVKRLGEKYDLTPASGW